MRFHYRLGLGVVVVAFGLCGCSRPLNVERNVLVESLGVHEIQIDPPSSQQQVTVMIRSQVPLDVYLVLEKNRTSVSDQLQRQVKVESGFLDKLENVKEGQLEGTVPAGEGYAVLLSNSSGHDTKVAVKISGKSG